MTTELSKGTALISGASSGIGAVYADRLANRAYNLVLVARSRRIFHTSTRRLATSRSREISITHDLPTLGRSCVSRDLSARPG